MKWKPDEFWITLSDSITKQKVKGEINGLFGIHGSSYNYSLTHLPTGGSITFTLPLRLKRTKKNLRIWAAMLATINLWEFSALSLPNDLKEVIRKLRSEAKLEDFGLV